MHLLGSDWPRSCGIALPRVPAFEALLNTVGSASNTEGDALETWRWELSVSLQGSVGNVAPTPLAVQVGFILVGRTGTSDGAHLPCLRFEYEFFSSRLVKAPSVAVKLFSA